MSEHDQEFGEMVKVLTEAKIQLVVREHQTLFYECIHTPRGKMRGNTLSTSQFRKRLK